MRTRANKIKDFEKFQDSVEAVFKKRQKTDPDYLSLEDYYGFSVCPRGRAGGLNFRKIDVFKGNIFAESNVYRIVEMGKA